VFRQQARRGGGPAIEYSRHDPCQLHGGGEVILKNLTVAKFVEKISCTLWKPKVHYRVYKNLLLVHVLCQMNPDQNFSHHIFKIYFNIILPSTPRCSNRSVDFTFSNQNQYAFLNSNRRATRPTYSTLRDLITLIFGEKHKDEIHYSLLGSLLPLQILLTFSISPGQFTEEEISPCSSLGVRFIFV
jgi:hypothetical protein